MLDTHALELINAEIDGELTADERTELEQLLASSAEARSIKAELQKLSNLMAGLPEHQPPADLGERILGQVSRRGRRRSLSLANLFASLQPVPMGAAFAAGLLLTAGFYELSSGPRAVPDFNSMVGTMMPGSESDQTGRENRLAVAGPGVVGTVALSGVGDIVVLSFDVVADQETEFVIAMGNAGLGFGGIAHGTMDDSAIGASYEVSGGNLRVVSETSHPFNVYLRRVENGKAHPLGIGIEVIYSGERVFEGLLEFAGERG